MRADVAAESRPLKARVRDGWADARTLVEAGVFGPERPDRAARALLALRRWGASPAAGYAVYAGRTPNRVAICDESGSLTFAEVEARTNAIARGFAARGIGGGS